MRKLDFGSPKPSLPPRPPVRPKSRFIDDSAIESDGEGGDIPSTATTPEQPKATAPSLKKKAPDFRQHILALCAKRKPAVLPVRLRSKPAPVATSRISKPEKKSKKQSNAKSNAKKAPPTEVISLITPTPQITRVPTPPPLALPSPPVPTPLASPAPSSPAPVQPLPLPPFFPIPEPPKPKTDLLVCDLCDLKLYGEKQLAQHRGGRKCRNRADRRAVLSPCAKCNRIFETRHDRDKHIQTKHQ